MGLNQQTSGSGHPKIDTIQTAIHDAVGSLKLRYYLLQSVGVVSVLLLFWLAAGALESYFYMAVAAKIVLWALAIGATLLARQYIQRNFSYPDYRNVYRYLARHYGFSELSHLLDLADVEEQRQSGFHKLAIEQNLNSISLDDFHRSVSDYLKSHPLFRYFRYTGAGAAALLTLAIALFAYHSGPFVRFAQPWNAFSPPNPYQFTIHPGSATIEQGGSFQPRIRFSGAKLPDEVVFAFKTDKENNYRRQRMRAVSEDSLVTDALSISNDIRYHIKMDGYRSASYNVDVQIKPRFANLRTKVTPPAYTDIPTQTHTYPFSTIKLYPGSEVEVAGKSNKNLKSLYLRRSRGDTVQSELALSAPDTFSTSFEADMQDDTLRFTLVDSTGLTNDNPFRIRLAKRQDQTPVARIHAPKANLKINEPRPVVIEYSASDDFGLVKARLAYTLKQAYVDNPQKGSIPLDLASSKDNQTYQWALDSLGLKPRDQLTYWIEVWDNDTYQGYKKGTSRKQTIAIASMSEYVDELEEKESEVSSDLDDLSRSYEQMQKEYERFKDQLKRDPQADWKHSKSLKEVSEKRKEIQKKAEELNKKFKELSKELKNNNMLSKETLQAYQELQKIMEKIDDPELLKQLQKMQQNLQNMSQDQLRKAMEDVEFNEELYKERLKRTKELFQKLKLNSDLEKMARSLDRLSEEEKNLAESADTARAEQQSKQQQDIKEDLQKVKEQLNQTGSDTSGYSKEIRKQLESLDKQTRSDFKETQKKLEENLKKLQQLKKQQSKQQNSGGSGQQQKQQQNQKLRQQIQQQQQQIQQQMQQMSSNMRQTKSQINQQQSRINLAALMYIQQNLVMLSEDQEQLNRETGELSNRSAAFAAKARTQETINKEFQHLADSLFSVSAQMPSIKSSFNRKRKEVARDLERAVEMLSERDKNQSTSIQRNALGGINEMASRLTSIIDQLQDQMSRQPGAGGSMSAQQFMQQLQKMSGNQQKLNQQIQKMINDIQGERLSRDQMKRLEQMARQQNAIRKQLKELQKQGSDAAGEKLMSEMERMAEQMEKTINDLRGGATDAQLVERQQNILSRMLNAEKAVQERGKSKKRKARRPEDYQRQDNPQITMEELRQQIRSRLNDPDQTDFKDDYQKLIEYYFKLLEDLNVQEQIN